MNWVAHVDVRTKKTGGYFDMKKLKIASVLMLFHGDFMELGGCL
jgi:hypothetical protein